VFSCPETSVTNYQPTLPNISEWRRPQPTNPLGYFGSILRQSQTNAINVMQGVTQTSRQASTFNARFTVRVCLLRPVSDGLQLSLKNVELNNYTPYIFFSTLKNVAKHRHKKVPCHFLNSVFRDYRVLGSTSHYRIFAIFFSPAGEIKTYQDGFLQHVTQFCLHRNASPYTDITQQCFPTMSPAVPFWLRKTNTGLYILADVNTVSG